MSNPYQRNANRSFYSGLILGGTAILFGALLVTAALSAERPDEQKWHIGQSRVSTGYICATQEAAEAGLDAVRLLTKDGTQGFTLIESDPILAEIGCAYVRQTEVTLLGVAEDRVTHGERTWAIARWRAGGLTVFSWLNAELFSTKKFVDKVSPGI